MAWVGDSKRHSEASKKAWETIRRKKMLEARGEQDQAQNQIAQTQLKEEQKQEVLESKVEADGITLRSCLIQPPSSAPIFYDIDGNAKFLERVLKNNKSLVILFRGEPSTGKTKLIQYLQYKFKKPVIRINVTVNTEVSDLKGKWILKRSNGKVITEWVDGLITTALKTGAWLQIEEVNFMRREHQSIFYSLFDERREIILENKDGERITNPNLVAFLTMNPSAFLRPLIPALKSRIDLVCEFSHLDVKRQAKLLIEKYECPEDLAKQISEVIDLLRKKYEGEIDFGSRDAENWCKMLRANGTWERRKNFILRAFMHTVALKHTNDKIITSSMKNVAEAVITGKIGYEEMVKEIEEKKGEDDNNGD